MILVILNEISKIFIIFIYTNYICKIDKDCDSESLIN